ncbi:hypothetical protein SGRA_1805 [Saprospira grandis str. Lewin]|uniref:Uncharacterized protein n=1 Tax=Saprospira grandis (strain Lewin) TaxID=984262 RepID=H6L0K4_SAPGL|nr:hypothetical protein SGRA_1805 [Saprospira grandis str. Lewin]
MRRGGRQARPRRQSRRRAEQTCEPQSVAPAEGGRPQNSSRKKGQQTIKQITALKK